MTRKMAHALLPLLVLSGASVQAQTAPRVASGPAGGAKPAAQPSPKDLKYPPLRPIQPPSLEPVTLPNGMRLYLLEDHELPLVAGQVLIRTGTLFDPPDKIGLAALTAAVLRTGGAGSKTGDQIDRQLENLAATMESSIHRTAASLSFSAVKENAGQVLEVFRDVLTSPEFGSDKIDLRKMQAADAIARRNDDAGKATLRELGTILYGKDNPFGWMEQYDTVNRVTRADLQSFHRRYYFPKNLILSIWGDFNAAAMKTRITELFAGWTVEQPPVPEFPKLNGGAASGVYLAEKKNATRTFLAVGHLGGQFSDKDCAAVEIAARILGGGSHSRLFDRIRRRMAIPYDISAQWAADFSHPGLFQIAGSVDAVSTVDALKAIREEVERMRTAEVSEEELRTAKEAALNSFVFAFDSRAKILAGAVTDEYYGYPRDFFQQYQKAVSAVTREDVMRVARQRFDPAKLTMVVVGNPILFGQGLESLNTSVQKLDLTIPEAKPQATKGDESSMARGRQMLLRAQQAAGSTERLAAVKDYTEVAEFLLSTDNGGLKGTQIERWIAPNLLRQESVVQAGKISVYFDGRAGWIATPQGFGGLGGGQLRQVQGDLFRLYFRLLLSDQIRERTVNALDGAAVEISDPAGQIATVEFDEETSLPRFVRYDLAQATGAPVRVKEEYGDFREIGGVKVPHKIAITRGGRKFAEVSVTEYKINSGLKTLELARRPQ